MIEEEELLHVFARLVHVLARLGADVHALGDGDLAGGLELGLLLDLVGLRLGVELEDVEHHGALPGGRHDLDEAHIRQFAATERPGCQQ